MKDRSRSLLNEIFPVSSSSPHDRRRAPDTRSQVRPRPRAIAALAVTVCVMAWFCLLRAASAEPGAIRVVVHVTSEATGKPVVDREVFLIRRASVFFDIFRATTDAQGDAVFTEVTTSGEYDAISYGGLRGVYDTSHVSVTIRKYSDTREYAVNLPLKPGHPFPSPKKPPGERELTIRVRGKTTEGSAVPVHFASIYDRRGEFIIMTDYNGLASLRHDIPLGESCLLRAEATRWKPAANTFVVGQGGTRLTSANDRIDFLLEPEEREVAATLTVEVLDRATSKPLPGATVSLLKPVRFPGIEVGTQVTGANGEVTFTAEALEQARVGGAARVGAGKAGYDSATEDVGADLLANPTGRYTIFLKPVLNAPESTPTAVPPRTNASVVWVLERTVINSNGQDGRLPPGLQGASKTGFTFAKQEDGQAHQNSLTWTEPPAVIPDGGTVSLTIKASTNLGATVTGWWNFCDWGADSENHGSSGANSFEPGKSSSTHTFKFKPYASDAAWIQISAGHDPNPNEWMVVTWHYRKQAPGKSAFASLSKGAKAIAPRE